MTMIGSLSDRDPPPLGGRVCSLEYRPRRWFGFRLERVLRDFLAEEPGALAGLGATVSDLLQGVVRPGTDRRVNVSAHHSRAQGVVLISVDLSYRLPSSDPEHVWAIVGWLGRSPRKGSYFRLGSRQGVLPVHATVRVETEILRADHGESEVRTTFFVRASVQSTRSLGAPPGRGEGTNSRARVIPIRGS